ncbi:MAG: twin-arginine translocation signal domain-containing protein [Betaproteobacteria bacterium]|nr:twin-arginine translocation signal domain-containing protein [Betaproteobacteria bacterium]
MKKPDRKLSRRSFLLAVGAGGAAATVALVSKEQEQNASGSAKTETSQGYRLTEHVQNYYRTAKV